MTTTVIVGVPRLILRAVRPRQWSKNLVIFLALFFTVNEAWTPPDVAAMLTLFGRVAAAFVLFCALTSAVYLINDIFDVERDRKHPRKRFRPIASGQLSVGVARTFAALLAAVGLAGSFWLSPFFGALSVAYLTAMFAYSIAVKHIVLLDVFTISAGFVIRVIAGAAVIGVPISPWLYICTGLGALLMALAKRRSELVTAGENAIEQRGILEHYTKEFLDQLIVIVGTSSVLAYSLYTFSAENLPKNGAMMLTIPFVVYGLFRFIYLIHTKNLGENADDVLTDAPLVIAIVLWLTSAAVILGLFRP